jgi:hypothetical protein
MRSLKTRNSKLYNGKNARRAEESPVKIFKEKEEGQSKVLNINRQK